MATPTREAPYLNPDFLGLDVQALKRSLAHRLEYIAGKDIFTATTRDWLNVVATTVRDRLVERWMETMRTYYIEDAKRVYYLSLEFLMGRTLVSNMLNLGITEACREALNDIGLDLDEICEVEPDAALGNGGLGRLAACFLDSMATIGIPGYGYGIRYEYGMFHQKIEKGRQVEHPDSWLRYGNPWEFPRAEVLYPVRFGGRVIEYPDERGDIRHHWIETDDVMAMAYDTPIPGYNTNTVNNMRLWAAKSTRDFDLRYFNEGNYIKAVESKTISENISKVLYPEDSTSTGRELRLRQQYFFVSASLQDILYRFSKYHDKFDVLPDKVAIQLNDTHPAIAIPELMRVLVDLHRIDWDHAWDITTRTFSYTNHTLMPEALETWPVKTFERLLPRHLQIIYEINHRFLNEAMHKNPGDAELLRRMSLIDENGERRIRMAHLAIVGSHHVNGVAKLHTKIMKETIFSDFERFYPGKIVNKTNGITPRRWLHQANPLLSDLISSCIGTKWVTDLCELEKLMALADDSRFHQEFYDIKQANKRRLAALVEKRLGVKLDILGLFDVQIKRIHEYKRQLLNVLHVITLYNRLRNGSNANDLPRTVIIAGKAAPGYAMAKLIIRLINDVSDFINNDPAISDRLKLFFIPNYDVSAAMDIIPAADLSQQISTAGTEASGTGNMKLSLNGALTIGTLDGANIEIREEVGDENMFIFGHTVDEARAIRDAGYNPGAHLAANPELGRVLEMIGTGYFSPDEPHRYRPVIDILTTGGDPYMLLADYESYIACQDRVTQTYLDREQWVRKAIINVAHMGKFSSDRTIKEYADEIWQVPQVEVHLRKRHG